MLIIYRILINIIFLISPFIILIRIIKGKEDIKRFSEKLGFHSKKKRPGKLIWFHGASVGEIKSIIPLIDKFEKKKDIKQILITSNTLSSSRIFKNYKLKKTIHQFFPIDTNFLTKKFINYWQPSKVFFIDSEIWPNMILNLKRKKIPLLLVNGRITKKTFNRWSYFKVFSRNIFSNFDLCLASSKESKTYLTKLNLKRIEYIGNLKFTELENEKLSLDKKLKNFFSNKKIWCASSTHYNEEVISGYTHLRLKKKFKNLLTIIIPRHVERSMKIKKELENLNLKVHLHETKKKIQENTDIYLVNSYGKTKLFFNNCKNVFLGGSLVNRGGQNPLEAARFGCNILYGPNTYNFSEIYEFLKKRNVAFKVHDKKSLPNILTKLFMVRTKTKKIKKKINILGKNILKETYKITDSF